MINQASLLSESGVRNDYKNLNENFILEVDRFNDIFGPKK